MAEGPNIARCQVGALSNVSDGTWQPGLQVINKGRGPTATRVDSRPTARRATIAS
jgi:hypothetical protein